MRKLLLLGGSRYAIPVIEAAHKLNCFVITCDFLPDNIAHKYSDAYENISIIEKDTVLKVSERNTIDGIMSFACDPGVTTAAYVAEKMGLPSCGSYESVSILQNKRRFREYLTKNGFNAPWSFGYTEMDKALCEEDRFEYPLIVKPTDSAGSKGVRKVSNKSLLKESIDNALKNSRNGEFIIEQYLESDGAPSDSECFTVNGSLKFVSFSSQKFDPKSANPYTPAGFTWKPDINKENREILTAELQRLLTNLGMRSSLYNIEARQSTDGKAYLMEVSPRGGGNRLAEMIKYATGTDLVLLAVKSALGDRIEDSINPMIKGNWAEIILHGRKSGKFRSIHLSKEITDNLVEKDLWIKPGDHIGAFTGANMTIGTLVLNFSSEKMMDSVMEDPYNYIDIIVEE